MAGQAQQRAAVLQRNSGYAHLADASLWTSSRSSDRQAHSENHERIPADAARFALSRIASPGKRGWVIAKWETAPDRNREFKYYRLMGKGRKQLVVEESQWRQMAEAVARVMWPATEES
jgi:hypothetical protein